MEANAAYLPQGCSQQLALRIYKTASEITWIDTIRHLTSKKALKNIIDDALYGRKILEERYMQYTPAALAYIDVIQGDANVICLGPQEIDPNSIQHDSIEITLNFNKLDHSNPCAFAKQKDLGFRLELKRQFTIGNKTFYFSHTDEPGKTVTLKFFSELDEEIAYFQLPAAMMITYDKTNAAHFHLKFFPIFRSSL